MKTRTMGLRGLEGGGWYAPLATSTLSFALSCGGQEAGCGACPWPSSWRDREGGQVRSGATLVGESCGLTGKRGCEAAESASFWKPAVLIRVEARRQAVACPWPSP